MKPDEREDLMERYLSGSMTPMEQHEFRIRLALDDELSRMVRACGMVDGVIAADRRDLMTDDSALRSRVLSMSMAGRDAGSVGEKIAGTGRKVFGLFRAVLLSVAVIGSAGFLLLSNGDEKSESPAAGDARTVSDTRIDTVTAPTVSAPLPSQAPREITEERPAPPSSLPSQREAAPIDRAKRASSIEETTAPTDHSRAAVAAPPEDVGIVSPERPQTPSRSVVTDTLSGSVNMKGRIPTPRRVK